MLKALVRARSAYEGGIGLLLQDRRTVLLAGDLLASRRQLEVSLLSGAGRARTRRIRRLEDPASGGELLLLDLATDLPGSPLRISETPAELGSSVFVVMSSEDPRQPVVLGRSIIALVTDSTISLAATDARILLVLDERGAVLGIADGRGRILRPAALLRKPARKASVVLPYFGLNVGFGNESADVRQVALSLDLGIVAWDRFVATLQFGFAGGFSNQLLELPAADGLGPGVVNGNLLRLNLGLEVKYRLLLSDAYPFYLELAAGGRLSSREYVSQGLALYSATAECSPASEACQLLARDPGDSLESLEQVGVGPVFGLDLRWLFLTIGYRFIPGALSYRLPNTHLGVIGLGFF